MSASTSGTGPILYHTLGSRLGIVQVAGFVQSLEFLQKVLKFPSNFLDLEKVWKIERKSGKMVKSLQFYNKCYYTIMRGNAHCLCTYMNLMGSIKLPSIATVKCIRLVTFIFIIFWLCNSQVPPSGSGSSHGCDVNNNIVICKYWPFCC